MNKISEHAIVWFIPAVFGPSLLLNQVMLFRQKISGPVPHALAATVILSLLMPDTIGQTVNWFLSFSPPCSPLVPSWGVYLSQRRLSPQSNYLL